jgi:hypothetical protein
MDRSGELALDDLVMAGNHAGGLVDSSVALAQRTRAASWPLAVGRIEPVEVTKPACSFTTKRGYDLAELGYSYPKDMKLRIAGARVSRQSCIYPIGACDPLIPPN